MFCGNLSFFYLKNWICYMNMNFFLFTRMTCYFARTTLISFSSNTSNLRERAFDCQTRGREHLTVKPEGDSIWLSNLREIAFDCETWGREHLIAKPDGESIWLSNPREIAFDCQTWGREHLIVKSEGESIWLQTPPLVEYFGQILRLSQTCTKLPSPFQQPFIKVPNLLLV